MGSYSCSYCLDGFKVAAILLKVDWFLVEEPLESHVQRRVVCGLAAQHHTLPYGHLHSARAKHHTHGLWKHKTAALSPQAHPKLALSSCDWLQRERRSNDQKLVSASSGHSASLRWTAALGKFALVIWFLNVKTLLHAWSSTINFPAPNKWWGVKWHWGLFTGGWLVLIWQKIKASGASLTFYPQCGSHLCRAQLILCPAHVGPFIRSAGVNNFQSVVS